MATKKGIDVSVWNGTIDWSKTSQVVDFAILRAGYGKVASQKDKQFENNYAGCKKYGVPMGVYWYNYAKTVADAKIEAQVCLSCLNGKKLDYPVYYDIEESSVLSTGKSNVSAIAKAFLDIIAAAGYKTGIYASASPMRTYFTDELKNKHSIWVAHYGVSKPSYTGTYDIWQYSSTGSVNGISGKTDMNYGYKDYSSDSDKSDDTTPTPTPTPSTDTIDVTYQAYTGQWWGVITNCNDTNANGYAGVENKPIQGITAKASKGTLKYRVHLRNGGWLGWISKMDANDWNWGVAGIKGKPIDGIQFDFSGVDGYKVKYRVSTTSSKDYLNWITGYGTGSMGYAGIYGKPIDKIQVKIEKG